MRRAIVLVATLSMLAAACTKVETPPQPSQEQPDRVVAVELKCDLLLGSDGPLTFSGWDVCPWWTEHGFTSGTGGFGNLRKELTIRTAQGTTYKVSYGAEHDVWLGMEWPPK